MVNQEKFIRILQDNGVTFFSGVPDSYLNGFNNYLKNNVSTEQNVITANEGNAIALAAGHHFATGSVPFVYMQNSGLGNCVNPLLSLTDKNVYAVPMILLIGWRGEQGTKDGTREQHIAQGRLTKPLLENMGIPYHVLSDETALDDALWAVETAKEIQAPVALIAPDKVMTEKKQNEPDTSYPMSREDAIAVILDSMPKDTLYTATTGRATRELFCQRELRGETHRYDFLNIGSMGHASSVAQGIAMGQPKRNVVCLDGDAAAVMHMGNMAIAGSRNLPNYIHIVLNNGAHESVGGQPSVGHTVNFTGIAENCGFYTVGHSVATSNELVDAIRSCIDCGRQSFIDVRIHSGLRNDLGAITMNSHEMIEQLKKELKK